MTTSKETNDAVIGCIALTIQAVTFLTALTALILSITAL